MSEKKINGLIFEYEKKRDLFNTLLKINGVTKKDFCKKFNLSYSYVNAWGSIINDKEKKYPNWVFVYLEDVMFFKIASIRVKISLDTLNKKTKDGQNLSEIYKELYTKVDDLVIEEFY
jgi:hypothetical protein